MPGGVCDPQQWLLMDQILHKHGNGMSKIITRQTFQFHSVIKHHRKHIIQDINRPLLDTLVVCRDVNRSVSLTQSLWPFVYLIPLQGYTSLGHSSTFKTTHPNLPVRNGRQRIFGPQTTFDENPATGDGSRTLSHDTENFACPERYIILSRYPFPDALCAFSLGLLSRSPLQMILAPLRLWMGKEDSSDSTSPLGVGWV